MDSENFLGLLPLLLVVLIGWALWAKMNRDSKRASAEGLLGSHAPTPEYKGPLAFFRRHYNGDYSLGRSYWVNTFLVSLFAPLVGLLLLPWLGENFPARYGSLAFLFVTALGIVVWVWSVSGTWASANKHVSRGGRSGWASAAKVAIVLGILRLLGEVGELTPALKEHVQVASGAQFGLNTRLEVRADGRSILLAGGINDGSAAQLDDALKIAPSVSTVVLSSEGGWIREGKMIAEVIRKRDLNTYVEGACASACTIAFLAGKERAASPDSRIGFHASRAVGGSNAVPSAIDTEDLRSIYRDAGLPGSFIDRALDTPNDKMWHPSHEELLAVGVLTRKSMGGETAAVATALRSKASVIDDLKQTELFSALEQRSPQDFDNVVDAAWEKIQQGATDAEIWTSARAQLSAVVPRFLPLASDELLIEFNVLILDQAKWLADRNPSMCVELLFPSGKAVSIAGFLSKELISRELALTTQVIRDSDVSRRITPSAELVEEVASRVVTGMSQDQLQVISCRIPYDCIDSRRYPLFMARAAMRELVQDLTHATGELP